MAQLDTIFKEIMLWLGMPRNTTGHSEKLISAVGAGVAVFLLAVASLLWQRLGFLEYAGASWVVASMGASAVLLFAVPHGALSQPWALIGGHFISAAVGVACAKVLGDSYLAAGCAVGLAVGAMYYLRCIHPPGGATALTAVIGGASVHELGFYFLVVPVAVNVGLILVVALGFNGLFKWRRYPAHLFYKRAALNTQPASSREFELTQEDLSSAIQEHGSFIDITDEGLAELLEVAKRHAEKNITHPEKIVTGRFYSNGKLGKLWSVRQVVDASDAAILPSKDSVIYKVVAGDQSYITGICVREEFKVWARFEVVQKENRWVKAS